MAKAESEWQPPSPWLPVHDLRILTIIVNMLAVVLLFIFLIASCLIRRPRHQPDAIPFKSLFLSLCCHIITCSMIIASRLAVILQTVVHPNFFHNLIPYVAQVAIYFVFFYLRTLLMTYALYWLLIAYIARTRRLKKERASFSTLHMIILILLPLLPLLNAVFTSLKIFKFYGAYAPMENSPAGSFKIAGDSLILLASIEIMFEAYFILWKEKDLRPLSKKSATFFSIGVFLFFAFNACTLIALGAYTSLTAKMQWMYITPGFSEPWPDYLPLTVILSPLCIIGQYAAIIYCCMQWHKLGRIGPKQVSKGDGSSHRLIVLNGN